MYTLGASPPALPALRPATFPTVYTLGVARDRRVHFPSGNVPYRVHSGRGAFPPCALSGTERSLPCALFGSPGQDGSHRAHFPSQTSPYRDVRTNGPLVCTVGGLPCRNVHTVGVLFAVNAFRPERVPAVYTYGREARGLDGACLMGLDARADEGLTRCLTRADALARSLARGLT